MTCDQQHPFQPGTAVIVQRDYSHYSPGTFSDDEVLKVHKSGHFTLKSDPKQRWRPWSDSWSGDDKTWYGERTGSGGYSVYSTRVRLSDAAAKAERDKGISDRKHKEACHHISEFFRDPKRASQELSRLVLDAIKSHKAAAP